MFIRKKNLKEIVDTYSQAITIYNKIIKDQDKEIEELKNQNEVLSDYINAIDMLFEISIKPRGRHKAPSFIPPF